jgi:uncharacterized Ntn-hydrolase superfamily protein
MTDPRLGPKALDMIESGYRPEAVVRAFERSEDFFDCRQLVLLDCQGCTALHDGANLPHAHAVFAEEGCAAAGDRLAGPAIPADMVAAFLAAKGELAQRLLAGLRAAAAAGGEVGPLHAAGLLVADKESWPVVDLRVDDAEGDPVAELERLWRLWRPQMHDHIRRAFDPLSVPAPSLPKGAA